MGERGEGMREAGRDKNTSSSSNNFNIIVEIEDGQARSGNGARWVKGELCFFFFHVGLIEIYPPASFPCL